MAAGNRTVASGLFQNVLDILREQSVRVAVILKVVTRSVVRNVNAIRSSSRSIRSVAVYPVDLIAEAIEMVM